MDFTTQRLDNLNIDLFPGIDKDEIKKWMNTVYYNGELDKFFNTNTKSLFKTNQLWSLIRTDIVKYLDKSIIPKWILPSDRYNYKATARYEKALSAEIASFIIHNRNFGSLNLEQSPWVSSREVKIENSKLTITEPLTLKDQNLTKSSNFKRNNKFWNEYAKFNEELQWIVACRFASTRRKCFLWQRFPASWGKTFKSSIYDRLGIQLSMSTYELSKIMGGAPSGISSIDLYNKWIIFFDEFNIAPSALKDLNESLTLNQKHSYSATVPVYAKIFASAEQNKSLVDGGVETQYKERFLFQQLDGKLEDHVEFTENKADFLNDLIIYAHMGLSKLILKYQGMGQSEATVYADSVVDQMHEKYKFKGQSIEEIVEEQMYNLKTEIVEYYKGYEEDRYFSKSLLGVTEHCMKIGDIVYVKNLNKCEDAIHDYMNTGVTRKKVGYKALTDISDFPSVDQPPKRKGPSPRAYVREWFTISSLHEPMQSTSSDQPEHIQSLEDEQWKNSEGTTSANTDKISSTDNGKYLTIKNKEDIKKLNKELFGSIW